MCSGVNATAFYAVINDFRTGCFIEVLVSPIAIKPETENQYKACPKIEEKENIYI